MRILLAIAVGISALFVFLPAWARDTTFALPVRVIEIPDVERSSKVEKDEEKSLSLRDLSAQESMARSAREGLNLAWTQIVISVFGTFAVIYTIKLSIDGNKASIEAVRAAQIQAESNRAWLLPEQMLVYHYSSGGNLGGRAFNRGKGLGIVWKNFGSSPALNCEMQSRIFIMQSEAELPRLDVDDGEKLSPALIAPGVWSQTPAFGLLDTDFDEWKAGKVKVFVYSVVRYKDIYDKERRTECCWEFNYTGSGLVGGQIQDFIQAQPAGGQNGAT